ncbi:MAG TPA: sigma-70 family RNA polymerase sigma factor [Vicinamibacterales bacterium]|nr:sigma-70 family RNA polymerase sigma factor [Vicinamibacterales bacterium]
MTKTRNPSLSDHEGAGLPADAEAYAALIRRAAGGDRPALERLLMEAQGVAYRFSLLVCGQADDAEDVMQDALLKTYRYAGRIRAPEAFRTWLYRTVKNACLMRRRRRVDEPRRMLSLDELMPSRDGRPLPIDVPDAGLLPEAQALNRALGRRLQRALAALPSRYRVLVFLRDMEGLSTREVARVLGISEANVKTRLHRARLFLRQQLEEQETSWHPAHK